MLSDLQGSRYLQSSRSNNLREGFTGMLGESAADAKNSSDQAEVTALEDKFNRKLSDYVRGHTTLMEDTQRFVNITASGENIYAGKCIRDAAGRKAYVTRYGIVHPLSEEADSYMSTSGTCDTVDFPESIPAQPDMMVGNTGLITGKTIDKPFSCGFEGQSIQVVERNDSEALWAASSGASVWPEATQPYGQLQARADGQTSPYVGCLQSPSNGVVQEDLPNVDRYACFVRAIDQGHNAFGLTNASSGAGGEAARGQCITYPELAKGIAETPAAQHSVVGTTLFADPESSPTSKIEAGLTRDGRFVVVDTARNPSVSFKDMEPYGFRPVSSASDLESINEFQSNFEQSILKSFPESGLAGCGLAVGGNLNFSDATATLGPPYTNCQQAVDVNPEMCLERGLAGGCSSTDPYGSNGNLGTFMQQSCAATCQSPSLQTPVDDDGVPGENEDSEAPPAL